MGRIILKREHVLQHAAEAVQMRNARYGEPEDNFARIAILWNAWLEIRREPAASLTSADVAIMLAQMKHARLANDITHIDSWIDGAGYMACGAECAVPSIMVDFDVAD